MQENPTITAAEIARAAGVGRAAVSNWRKRHPDFPDPVGGTSASPEFDLSEVETWLRTHGKLPEIATADRLWRRLAAVSQSPAEGLVAVGDLLLARLLGDDCARERIEAHLTSLLPDIDALVAEHGLRGAFDELWARFTVPNPGRPFTTPDDLADLMVGLAGVAGRSVLDPAAGSGAILRAAVRAGCRQPYGQEIDEDLAKLAELWLALRDTPGQVRGGDSLRADAFGGQAVDAVVCHPPFGATNWGDEELGHDPRWIVGTTPRTEPELAWVQHALAHLNPGGHAVLLMPPTVASRRAGRRIRGELLRRGALRAVVALAPGVAAPHGVPLHLWVLRRAAPDAPLPTRVLMVDAAHGDLAETAPRVLAAWRAFDPDAEVEEAGFARAVPIIELLDEDIDLTPTRRQPTGGGEASGEHLVRVRTRLAAVLAELSALMPQGHAVAPDAPVPDTLSIAELARTGALQIVGPVRVRSGLDDSARSAATDGVPVLTGRDVVEGAEASGRDDGRSTERVPLLVGDVVVPVAARRLTSRVVTAEGALLGSGLYLLRPNPDALDPWFLAGQLRSSANDKQATSLSGTRLDVRRAQVRRLPLDVQRAYGTAFRHLLAFETALGEVRTLGTELVRSTVDGLAAGVLAPGGERKVSGT